MKKHVFYGLLVLLPGIYLQAMDKPAAARQATQEESNSETEEQKAHRIEALQREFAAMVVAVESAVATRGFTENALFLDLAEGGFYLYIEAALVAGVNINAQLRTPGCITDGNTPLIAAAQGGHEKFVTVLLTHRPDIHASNARGYTALMEAKAAGHKNIVTLLLASGAHDSKTQKELNDRLLRACYEGNLDEVRALLKIGAAANARSDYDIKRALLPDGDKRVPGETTPLIWACEGGNFSQPDAVQTEIVKLLLAKGACVNVCNSRQQTALMKAAMLSREEIVTLLLAAGADVSCRDADRKTAMAFALQGATVEVVKHLLAAGASRNINIALPRNAFLPALAYCARRGLFEKVRVLFEHNEELDPQVIQLAQLEAASEGHRGIADYLKQDPTLKKA